MKDIKDLKLKDYKELIFAGHCKLNNVTVYLLADGRLLQTITSNVFNRERSSFIDSIDVAIMITSRYRTVNNSVWSDYSDGGL